MARFMSNARERVRKSIGQNPPALVSQMVPLHLRYRPMPIPRMHGIIPNTAIPTNAFCRADEPAIPFPFEEARESTHTEKHNVVTAREMPLKVPSRTRGATARSVPLTETVEYA
jgi:hypothetical protein